MSGPTPYATGADAYWKAGWRGVLPLPPKKKANPPDGTTGRGGVDPSYPDVYSWIEEKPGGNVCLRLPVDIVGIDVDNYGDKTGGATLTALEAELGALPATWRTTSRDDGVSGIRLYRAPGGMSWQNPGDSIEIIHHGWRYAVVWPSLHPEGRTYRWITPGDATATTIPNPDELPNLPAAWVERLNTGTAELVNRSDLDHTAAAVWVAGLANASNTPCSRMGSAATDDVTNLSRPTTTGHDTACAAVARIVRLGAEGHHGAMTALGQVHDAFISNVTRASRPAATRRDHPAAQYEWLGILVSAVNLVSANAPAAPSCDCDGQLTALIVGDRQAPATDGTAALAPETSTPTVADAELHTTWWPRDLAPILSGEVTEEPPTILMREDGQPLWYRGKVNGLLGESESGKTWLALEAVRQVLTFGGRVLYLDFEDAAPGIVSRLRTLGVADHVLAARLTYMDPAETLHNDANLDLSETLAANDYELIVVDGFNAAMTMLGLDLISNTDATRFSQMLLKPLAKTGAAVAYVDHLPKNGGKDESSGGIGAQAKRAMTTGCAIKVKVVEPFGKGMTGRLDMTVDKDRAGHVRGNSGSAKNAGRAILESNPDTGAVRVVIQAPDLTSSQQRQKGKEMARWEAISECIRVNGGEPSTTTIRDVLGVKKETLISDLDTMQRRGIVLDTGSSNRRKWRLLEPFTVADALSTPPSFPPSLPVPHRSGTVGEAAVTNPSLRPPPFRGTERDGLQTGGSEQRPDHRGPFRTEDGFKVNFATGEVLDS